MSETFDKSLATPAPASPLPRVPLICPGCGCHLGHVDGVQLALYRDAVELGGVYSVLAHVPGAANITCSNCGRPRWYRPPKHPKVTP